MAALGVASLLVMAALIWIMRVRREVSLRTRQLWEISLLDPLTGAANRRQFNERLEAEMHGARRNGALLSLLMVDVDYFKVLNDSEGHQRGDTRLIEVVMCVQSVVSAGGIW